MLTSFPLGVPNHCLTPIASSNTGELHAGVHHKHDLVPRDPHDWADELVEQRRDLLQRAVRRIRVEKRTRPHERIHHPLLLLEPPVHPRGGEWTRRPRDPVCVRPSPTAELLDVFGLHTFDRACCDPFAECFSAFVACGGSLAARRDALRIRDESLALQSESLGACDDSFADCFAVLTPRTDRFAARFA